MEPLSGGTDLPHWETRRLTQVRPFFSKPRRLPASKSDCDNRPPIGCCWLRRPDGVANSSQLVGDYHNPILTPEAAAALKRRGELALAGGFPNAEDQCRPIAAPFSSAVQFDFQILKKKNGDLAFIGHQDDQVRNIRMNG